MIRINLLDVRPRSAERLDSILSTGASSTFISRREALAGALFLALTIAIMGVLAMKLGPGEESAEAVSTPEEPAAALATRPEPAILEAELLVSDPQAAESDAADVEAAPPAGPAPPPDAPPARVEATAAAPGGPAVTAVRATPLADRLDVFLETGASPQVKSFRVDNPSRLVFDIEGAQLAIPDAQRIQAIASPFASRLRIAQFTIEPPTVRLVLEAGAAPAQAAVSTSPAGVSIVVTPAP